MQIVERKKKKKNQKRGGKKYQQRKEIAQKYRLLSLTKTSCHGSNKSKHSGREKI